MKIWLGFVMAMIRKPVNSLYVEKAVYKQEVKVLCFKAFTEPCHCIKAFHSCSRKDTRWYWPSDIYTGYFKIRDVWADIPFWGNGIKFFSPEHRETNVFKCTGSFKQMSSKTAKTYSRVTIQNSLTLCRFLRTEKSFLTSYNNFH